MKPLGHTKSQLIVSTILITAFSGALAAIDQHRQAYGIAVCDQMLNLNTQTLSLHATVYCNWWFRCRIPRADHQYNVSLVLQTRRYRLSKWILGIG